MCYSPFIHLFVAMSVHIKHLTKVEKKNKIKERAHLIGGSTLGHHNFRHEQTLSLKISIFLRFRSIYDLEIQ